MKRVTFDGCTWMTMYHPYYCRSRLGKLSHAALQVPVEALGLQRLR